MLKGKVERIKHGVFNTEIAIELPGGFEIVSIITRESADRLGLVIGKETYVTMKASTVIMGIK